MPKLPHEPQPMIQMQRRFALAVERYVDMEAVRLGTVLRPGEKRQHVFDFVDGLRLIVSREDWGAEGGRVIHVSASVEPETPLWTLCARQARYAGAQAAMELLLHEAKLKFRRVSGRDVPLTLDHISPEKNVPHWRCKVDDWEAAEKAIA